MKFVKNKFFFLFKKKKKKNRGSARGPKLFANYHALQRICTHPIVMKMNAEKMEKKRLEEEDDSEGSLKDFIDDGSDSSESSSDNNDKDGSDVQCVDSDKDVPIARRGTRANPIGKILNFSFF